MSPFGQTLDSEDELRTIFRKPGRGAVAKQIDHLDANCQAFIEHSPFVLVGTVSTDGLGDVSPKGGPAGFVKVLDEQRLAMGELPGNNRLDGYRNIVDTGVVGLLFLIPGLEETLRVNGRAFVVTEPSVLQLCALDGRLPKIALGVEVSEAFIHCGKAVRRSALWNREDWPDTSTMPAIACMLNEHVGITDDPDGSGTSAALEAGYQATMWNEPA